MSDTKQIIIPLNAKSLFDYFPKKPAENDQCFKLDLALRVMIICLVSDICYLHIKKV